jgi:hypothetical protein
MLVSRTYEVSAAFPKPVTTVRTRYTPTSSSGLLDGG